MILPFVRLLSNNPNPNQKTFPVLGNRAAKKISECIEGHTVCKRLVNLIQGRAKLTFPG